VAGGVVGGVAGAAGAGGAAGVAGAAGAAGADGALEGIGWPAGIGVPYTIIPGTGVVPCGRLP
jgi:hypothetical protein